MPETLLHPKATHLITAAMETAGASVQSEMLDFVASVSGRELAGYLYMFAIVSAVIVYASGGNYKWARYFLIGPTLFFFLTTMRTDSDGTEWSFANKELSPESLTKALSGVPSPSSGGGTQVALFYGFWNAFMSETTQSLIKMMKVADSDGQYNFLQKVERRMNDWNFSQIRDPNLRLLIKLTISNNCKEYFDALKTVNRPSALPQEKRQQQIILDKLKNKIAYVMDAESPTNGFTKELFLWAKENGLTGQEYTCQGLWEKIAELSRASVKDSLEKNRTVSVQPGQDEGKIDESFFQMEQQYKEIYSGKTHTKYLNKDAALLYAINFAVARSLWLEIWESNPGTQGFVMEGFSAVYNNGREGFLPGTANTFNETTSGAIQQFNTTDKYAERSEFINAALSMPYFQGIGLFILSAAYPFFAMLVVMPGRAHSFLTWMGLWAWLKLWDLGFSVVMMIDNMLYAMFPRGPNIETEDMKNAGVAWAKVFEVDPNYSQAVYYNLIATCMFAVPLATGVFVKSGGGELANLLHQGWSNWTSRIAGGPASLARSMQAQGYMADLQDQALGNAAVAYHAQRIKLAPDFERLRQLSAFKSALNAGKKISKDGVELSQAAVDMLLHNTELKINTSLRAAAAKEYYDTTISGYGQYAANRAVAARYYSHDLSTPTPYQAMFAGELANDFFDVTKMSQAQQGIFSKHFGGFFK